MTTGMVNFTCTLAIAMMAVFGGLSVGSKLLKSLNQPNQITVALAAR